MDHYEEYRLYRQYDREATAATGNLIILLIEGSLRLSYYGALISVRILYALSMYAPVLLAVYWSNTFLQSYILASDWEPLLLHLLLSLFIAYLTYSFIYFLKGFALGLKANQKYSWWLVLAVCVMITCFVPTLVTKQLILPYFKDMAGREVVCWLAASLVGVIIYSKYKFHQDTCPQIATWAYHLGFKFSFRTQGLFFIP